MTTSVSKFVMSAQSRVSVLSGPALTPRNGASMGSSMNALAEKALEFVKRFAG